MSTYISVFLAVFAGLFPVVNPLGGAPVFYQMMRTAPDAVRGRMALWVAIYGFTLLLVSMVLGSHILTFFGVSLPVLRVAGGLVVTVVGWQLLHQGAAMPEPKDHHTATPDAGEFHDMAFYPLTMPLTVGPGSIATAIALGSQGGTPASEGMAALTLSAIAALLGLFAVCLCIFIAYRYADKLERVLGRVGTNILVRLFAFILLCIGLQIMWTGLSQLIIDLR